MKLIVTLALLCGLLLSPAFAQGYSHKTPEQLGKSLYKVLKKQDTEGLPKLLPTEADFKSYVAIADMPAEEAKAVEQEMVELLSDFKAANENSLEEAIDLGSQEGVVLKKLKVVAIKVQTVEGQDTPMADIAVELSEGGRKYVLAIPGAGKVPSGWVLGLDGFALAPVEK